MNEELTPAEEALIRGIAEEEAQGVGTGKRRAASAGSPKGSSRARGSQPGGSQMSHCLGQRDCQDGNYSSFLANIPFALDLLACRFVQIPSRFPYPSMDLTCTVRELQAFRSYAHPSASSKPVHRLHLLPSPFHHVDF